MPATLWMLTLMLLLRQSHLLHWLAAKAAPDRVRLPPTHSAAEWREPLAPAG